jgi:hypothetical protein
MTTDLGRVELVGAADTPSLTVYTLARSLPQYHEFLYHYIYSDTGCYFYPLESSTSHGYSFHFDGM